MKRRSKASILTRLILGISLLALMGASGVLAPTTGARDDIVGTLRQAPIPSQYSGNSKAVGESIMIHLAAGEFDPLIESKPRPEMEPLIIHSYGPAESGYYIVQFDRPIAAKQKRDLNQLGVQVFDYLPDFAFIVKMDDAMRPAVESIEHVRWIGIYQPAYKITPSLARAMIAGDPLSQAEFIVTAFKGEDLYALVHQIEQVGGDVLDVSADDFGSKIRLRLDVGRLEEISRIGGVKWIEPAPVWKLFNDVAAGIMTVPDVWNSHNLYGAGQVVAVADAGLDQGSPDPANLHNDFEDGSGTSRVSQIFERAGDGASSDVRSGHGTHVAGSVLGNGFESGSNPAAHVYDNSYAGMAPEATLVFQAVEDNLTGFLTGIPMDLSILFQEAYDVDARIHTNSWGSSQAGAYTSFSEDVDQFIWGHKDFSVLFAAGNDGVDADSDGVIDLTSMASPATAKNCITVGATENNRPSGSTPAPALNSTWGAVWPSDYPVAPISGDHVSNNADGMAAFSSRGPCLDWRTKPDIVAPGTNIISTKSSLTTDLWGQGGLGGGMEDYYIFSGGTSMATPLVAGGATLAREFYTDVEGITPSAALIKATLLNGAADITPGQYGTGPSREIPAPPRPNNVEGWGRLDLETSIFPAVPAVLQHYDETNGLTTAATHVYSFDVGDGTVPLKVTLVWSDYPGSPVAGGGLVNDLDLILVDPAATWHYPKTASLIAYDDGGYENAWRFTSPGAGFAVKFTPTSYPAFLDKARFFLITSASAQFRCIVWDDDGAGGMPGTSLLTSDVTPPYLPSGGWYTVDISGLTIPDGSFYIELHYTSTDNNPYLGLDETNPDNTSYVYDSTSWSLLPYGGPGGINNGDWQIQAVTTGVDASDRVNNVVGIDIAVPAAGSYSIRVEGYNVPQGPQPYALVVSGGNLSPFTRAPSLIWPATHLAGQVISPTQVDLSWTDNSDNETGFRIERKQGSTGAYQQIGTTGPNENNFSDLTTIGGPTYYYRVRAYNGSGDSSSSNEIMVTPGLPDAPAGLAATAVSYRRIDLTWTDSSTGETGFKIERKIGEGGLWNQIATVGEDETTYADTACAGSTTYHYRVFSYNPNGDSPPSNEALATTPAAPVGGGGGGGGCFIMKAMHP